MPKLDRLIQFDERSKSFPIRTLLPDKPRRSYTWRVGVSLDQGNEGACVGFGWAHELAARPKVHPQTNDDAFEIYYVAQRVDEWPGECVDMETQCLTNDRGWVSGNDLLIGDSILTFDIETETTRWDVVEKIHLYDSKPYREWAHRGASVAVTDNHRWPVRTRPSGSQLDRPFRMTTTDDWKSGDEFIRSAPCSDLPIDQKWDDDFVELVAWAITEGYYRPPTRRGNGIVISQKTELNRVTELMRRLGRPEGHRTASGSHSWEISGHLASAVREVAPEKSPTIQWLSSLTQRQLRLFLDVCTLADGSHIDQPGRQQREVFSQKTGKILDSWLAATVLAGQPVSRASQGKGSGQDVETWTLRRSNSIEVRRLVAGPYKTGPVWCPQTAAGTFVARRNGTIFITGNSYEGTSVIAGAKIVSEMGLLDEYRWAFGENDLALAVGYRGPVVLGVNWYSGMDDLEVDSAGRRWARVSGEIRGGHCFITHGYSVPLNAYKCWNSWGAPSEFWITSEDMAFLLSDSGEACVPLKRR